MKSHWMLNYNNKNIFFKIDPNNSYRNSFSEKKTKNQSILGVLSVLRFFKTLLFGFNSIGTFVKCFLKKRHST